MNSFTARFGVFEADLQKRELRKQGRIIPFSAAAVFRARRAARTGWRGGFS